MPDELQQLLHEDNSTKENNAMWLQLIQEKRRGFDALVRAEGQAEYVVSLIFMPLCTVMAWQAKFLSRKLVMQCWPPPFWDWRCRCGSQAGRRANLPTKA